MKKRYRLGFYFFICFLFTLLIIPLIFRLSAFSQKKKVVVNHQIITPYYEKKVFQLPEEIKAKRSQTVSINKKIKIPIIMYHYVDYVKDPNDVIRKSLSVNPIFFEQELKTLKEAGYQTYFVKEIPDILDGKINYSTQSAVLTFDDGYEDFYTVVFPILKKYQMKATVYVIYDFIGRKGFMNEDEIKEVTKSGLVELGSHTLDHLYLKFSSESVARRQIFESKKKLEERFGVEVKTFAYPYGAFSQKTVDLVKEAGYIAAVSVIPSMQQSKDDLFYLGRVRPGIFGGKTIVKVIENYQK
jgi:peptidoglycan/xylan/chitin deacetylase (PgdA/CDA1 family)